MLRTHTCGALRKEDGDKEVTLCGWVAARRCAHLGLLGRQYVGTRPSFGTAGNAAASKWWVASLGETHADDLSRMSVTCIV